MTTHTVEEIRKIVKEAVGAEQGIASARGRYFRALLETAQAELSEGTDQAAQRSALKAVHARFYAVVLEAVVTPDIVPANRAAPEERKRRAMERNRRSNFARSSYSTILRWLKVEGHDLTKLKAASVTKSKLQAETPVHAIRRKVTAEIVQKRVHGLVEKLLAQTRALAPVNAAEARAALDAAMNQLAQELYGAGLQPTTEAAVAAKEHRPLRVEGSRVLFWPTESQVLRRHRDRKAVALKAAA